MVSIDFANQFSGAFLKTFCSDSVFNEKSEDLNFQMIFDLSTNVSMLLSNSISRHFAKIMLCLRDMTNMAEIFESP